MMDQFLLNSTNNSVLIRVWENVTFDPVVADAVATNAFDGGDSVSIIHSSEFDGSAFVIGAITTPSIFVKQTTGGWGLVQFNRNSYRLDIDDSLFTTLGKKYLSIALSNGTHVASQELSFEVIAERALEASVQSVQSDLTAFRTEFDTQIANIKGVGWTDETLKDIRDNLGGVAGVDHIGFSTG